MIFENFRTQPLILKPGAGPTLSFFGASLAYKITRHDTAGRWSLLEYIMPSKYTSLPLHFHKSIHEVVYVLAGLVTFRLGDKVFMAESDSLVYVPKGMLHTFSNDQDKPARFLMFTSPSGIEDYFKELAAMAQSDPSLRLDDKSKLRDLYKMYDIHFPSEE